MVRNGVTSPEELQLTNTTFAAAQAAAAAEFTGLFAQMTAVVPPCSTLADVPSCAQWEEGIAAHELVIGKHQESQIEHAAAIQSAGTAHMLVHEGAAAAFSAVD